MNTKESNSWDETQFLLSNPENAERLLESICQLQQGKTLSLSIDDIYFLLEENSETPPSYIDKLSHIQRRG